MSSYSPRLKAKYKDEVVPSLQKEFKYKSSMQVPKLVKINVNQGLGSAVGDKKIVENARLAFGPAPTRWPGTLHALPRIVDHDDN